MMGIFHYFLIFYWPNGKWLFDENNHRLRHSEEKYASKKEKRKEGRKEGSEEGRRVREKNNRQTHIASEHIAGISGDISCQPKVTDLRHPAVSQQNVSGCKIPVDALHTHTHTHTHTEANTNMEMSTDTVTGPCSEWLTHSTHIQIRRGELNLLQTRQNDSALHQTYML